MEKEQRDIYDMYRDTYRSKILGEIDQQWGSIKPVFTILQGLMKLRQICDSPAILNEEDKYPNHSIKLEELAREITENIGKHKAWCFASFACWPLIRNLFTEDGIPFEYFDGSTSATEREKPFRIFRTMMRAVYFNFIESGWRGFKPYGSRLCVHCIPGGTRGGAAGHRRTQPYRPDKIFCVPNDLYRYHWR